MSDTETKAAVCNVDGCNEIATGTYQWDWGERGACCDTHAHLLRQKSVHLDRNVHIAPLAGVPAAPLTRDERIHHEATRLALLAEIDQLKENGAQLYQSNTNLQAEVQRLGARNRQMEVELRDLKGDHAELKDDHLKAIREKNDAIAELQRTKLLVPPAPLGESTLTPQ